MLVITIVVFGINHPAAPSRLGALLFAIALSIGLSPELLPAILSITLAKGAQHMAAKGVIVRHLNAIENLGAMDILCTDKTGTLTTRCRGAGQARWRMSRALSMPISCNWRCSTPACRPACATPWTIRGTLAGHETLAPCPGASKLDEVPYDFVRKRTPRMPTW